MIPINTSAMIFLSTAFVTMNAIVGYVWWRGRRVQVRDDDEYNEDIIWQYRNRVNQPKYQEEIDKVKEK